MRVLILGGTKFFGKEIVSSLLRQGHNVSILTRGQVENPFSTSVEHLIADRKKSDQMKTVLKNKTFDIIIDNICMSKSDIEILRDSLSYTPKLLILTSTLAIYPLGKSLKEKDYNPVAHKSIIATNPMEEYAHGKREAEKFVANHFPNYAIIRLPIVLSNTDPTKRLYDEIKKVIAGEEVSIINPCAKFDFIRANDIAESVIEIAEKKMTGVYNLGSLLPWTLDKLYTTIAEINRVELKAYNFNALKPSPFSICDHYYMDTTKAYLQGLKIAKLDEWLPKLIKEMSVEIMATNEVGEKIA